VREILVRHRGIAEKDEVVRETRLGESTEVEHDLDEGFEVREPDEPLPDRKREDIEELSHFGKR
jgi:hypothetical protein